MKLIIQKILRFFTKQLIQKYHPKIIGITGSVGKTITKEAIFTVLSSKYRSRKSIKNYNNEIGVPLTFIGVESPGRSLFGWCSVFCKALLLLLSKDQKYPEIFVIEMGADRSGDIGYLLDFIPCDVGILTNISEAHMEFFGSMEKVIEEKSQIVTPLSKKQFAIMNVDDKTIAKLRERVKAKIFSYGFADTAILKASDVMISGQSFDEKTDVHEIRGISFKLNYQGSFLPISLPKVLGKQHVYAALAGAAAGIIFDMNLVEISESLKSYTAPPGRMNLLAGIKHTLIIDDSYNASPVAVKAALEVVSQIPLGKEQRKIAVLGDMLELGQLTEEAHRDVGRAVVRSKFDYLFTVGERAAHIASGAKDVGMTEDRIFGFSEACEAGRFLQERMEEGDVILVKASQGIRLEKIVKEIMAEPMKASELLVRQDQTWTCERKR